MSDMQEGGPAFPFIADNPSEESTSIFGIDIYPKSMQVFGGITKREYYAAKAMQSLIGLHISKWPVGSETDSISEAAFSMADAMIERGEMK